MNSTSEPANGSTSTDAPSRAERLERRRGGRRRLVLLATLGIRAAACGVGAYVFATGAGGDTTGAPVADPGTTRPEPTHPPTTTTTLPPTTTTTTVPKLKQPKAYAMPSPGSGISWGARGPIVALYEARMKQLHFDPGPVDGVFDQKTYYAVVSVQKYFSQPRTGRIDAGVQAALSHFYYTPAEPNSEADRVEIDLDRQVLTLFKHGQPVLVTTTSTGSGEHFCGGVDGCQYAITPTGHYHFYSLYRGWQKGKLGTMYNPYYFNGSIAVHGLDSVPTYPASHGCARIPIYVADYFYTLVHDGLSVFVVGTPKQAGSGYVGPVQTPVTAPPTTTPTTKPKPKTTTTRPTPTTVRVEATTVPKTTPTTTKKKP